MKVIYTESHRRHAPEWEFVRDRMKPYSESPARADSIARALRGNGSLEVVSPGAYPLDPIRAVHDGKYLRYLEDVYAAWVGRGVSRKGVVPHAFALRTMAGRPEDVMAQVGYYCFDAQTPIVRGTYEAALWSAYCALTGADMLLAGETAAYALCRPPGHHAGRAMYGGYCYLNNAAIAASRLSREGRVAILDVDYHHGNGTQDIFYDSDRVLYVSMHADPNEAYPFFCGFEDERGTGAGRGFNHNLALPVSADEETYLTRFGEALSIVGQFDPAFLVVSIGSDILRDDPLAGFDLSLACCVPIGEKIAGAQRPTLLVQEGGYDIGQLGDFVVKLLEVYV